MNTQVPLWLTLVIMAISFAVPWFLAWSKREEQKLRNDGNPSNDWYADVLKVAHDLVEAGDKDRAVDLIVNAFNTSKLYREKKG